MQPPRLPGSRTTPMPWGTPFSPPHHDLADIIEPAPPAAARFPIIRVERVAPDIEAQRRALSTYNAQPRPPPRFLHCRMPHLPPGARIAGVIWTIAAFVGLAVLASLKSLHAVETHDCLTTTRGYFTTRYTCKQSTWIAILLWAMSLAGLVEYVRRELVVRDARLKRCTRQWIMALGPVLVTAVAVLIFGLSAWNFGCFKGCA